MSDNPRCLRLSCCSDSKYSWFSNCLFRRLRSAHCRRQSRSKTSNCTPSCARLSSSSRCRRWLRSSMMSCQDFPPRPSSGTYTPQSRFLLGCKYFQPATPASRKGFPWHSILSCTVRQSPEISPQMLHGLRRFVCWYFAITATPGCGMLNFGNKYPADAQHRLT